MWRPSQLHAFLNERGVRPRKGLSQNFLIDGNVIARLISTAEVNSSSRVLEIGPGPGALTEALLTQGAQVIAVERDPDLATHLQRLDPGEGRLEIHAADILAFDFDLLPYPTQVVANLPFHLTTPILTRLISRHDLFDRIVVMVQEEVARRFGATAGTRRYGSISAFLQLQSEVRYISRVSRNCFFPAPNVDSAIVCFDLKPPPITDPELFTFIRRSFSQRRKMLKNSLREWYPPSVIEGALAQMGKEPRVRPEQLSPMEFVELYRRLPRNIQTREKTTRPSATPLTPLRKPREADHKPFNCQVTFGRTE